MFVSCPSCSTRYQIDASRIGAAGRKVRCTRCKHEWLQPRQESPEPSRSEPPKPAPRPADVEVIDPPSRADAAPPRAPKPGLSAPARVVTRSSAKRGGLLIGWLALVLVVAGVVAALWFAQAQIMTMWPATARLYALVGAESAAMPGEGLSLQEVKTETVDDNGIPTLVVTGKIVNTSAVPREVPKMRAALRDAGAQELQHWTFEIEAKRLLPGESLPFETRTQNPSQDAKGLSIVFVGDSGGE